MKEIIPFATLADLQQAIDNGGRFYNVFSQARDNVVSKGELAKAAGLFCTGVNAYLFLEMAKHDLSPNEQSAIEQMLEPSLRQDYQSKTPTTLLPSLVDEVAEAGTSAIVTGYPQFVENKAEFDGFVMIPITTGDVTTFTMIPIFDQYDVYEVFDDKQMRQPNSIVAVSLGERLADPSPVRFGGIVRKLEAKKGAEQLHEFYLEAVYYTRL